jgi:3-hydroxyacyl-CoA dehydrogenase
VSVVTTTERGNVALIQIDNPPVNATSVDVRRGLQEAFRAAMANEAVRAVVLACKGSTFVAGADIKEFGKPPQDPHLSVVIDEIERSGKPVVAAIQGTALGGGMELALGCHYRVADAKSRLGLPETTLGVIPGAGGVARLMRLAPPELALDMFVTGRLIASSDALAAGVVDEVVAGEVTDAAVALATRLVLENAPIRRCRDLPVRAVDPGLLAEVRKRLQTSHRSQVAPQVAVDLAEAVQAEDFDASIAAARARFRELVVSEQAKGMRNAFFAERVATQPSDLPKVDHGVRDAGVVGAGTMGTGIAMCFLNAGIHVALVEQNDKVLAASVETIRKTYLRDVEKGRLTGPKMNARLELLEPTLAYESLSGCDIVIEAVFEDIQVKKEVLARIERVVRPDAIVATNTSYLDIEQLADGCRAPERLVGMHFFSPANIMKLLENVRGRRSSPHVLGRIQSLGKKLGKVPVMVGVSDGFVGNRMLSKRARECFFMLEEGALPEQVDRVLYEFGFPMGQFQMNDLAGLDVAWRNRQGRLDRLTTRELECNILDELIEAKRLGQKSGAGFYRYDAQRKRSTDAEVTQLILRNGQRRGLVRREIDDQEIQERCVFAMINEGARILEEGVASRPEEIDTIWINGYGFPRYRGGPMFYADQIGPRKVLERVRHYASQVGSEFWTPAPLLEKLAEKGGGFYGR